MKHLLAFTAAIALGTLAGQAQELKYSYVKTPDYLNVTATRVRLRQGPSTSHPMLKLHVIYCDDDYTREIHYWDGDPNPDLAAYGPRDYNNEYAENITAYAQTDLLPRIDQKNGWSHVLYTTGEPLSNAGLTTTKAWIKSEFAQVLRPSGTSVSADDVYKVANRGQKMKLWSRSNQHSDFRWCITMDREGNLTVCFPFVTDDNLLVVGTINILYGAEDIGDGKILGWYQPENGMYARFDGWELVLRTPEKDPYKVMNVVTKMIQEMDHDEYENFVSKCMNWGYTNVWFKAQDGKMYLMPTETDESHYKRYTVQRSVKLK